MNDRLAKYLVTRRPIVVSVVGARPQFVKLAPLSTELRKHVREVVVHTGQHYDRALSGAFWGGLPLPDPDYNLGAGSGTHAGQTARIMERLEKVLDRLRPDAVIVYGDTNSTLAGALVAAKDALPLVHVEAGLRSFRRHMPEEINRVVADRLSDLLCCPTRTAVDNLRAEGIARGVKMTGDVMADTLYAMRGAVGRSSALADLRLSPRSYVVATIHRAENTDDRDRLRAVLHALGLVRPTVILSLHPRTRERLKRWRIRLPRSVRATTPPGYVDFIALLTRARAVCTDSGGVQKEAALVGTPCFTLREETEWVESVKARANALVPPGKWRDLPRMVDAARRVDVGRGLYPRGASARIARLVARMTGAAE